MNEYLLIKLLHIIGFAYWLGGDLGVFYSSYFVADEKRSTDVRVATAKILFALDQAPRICMTLMLPLGTHLAWKLGLLNFNGATMALVWLIGFGWLTMVITLHAAAQSKGKAMLTIFDFFFRLTLALGLIAAGVVSLIAAAPLVPYWLAGKVMIFGALVGCGLVVRIKLKPFGPAFANLASGQASDADNAAIRASLAATRPFVVSIWAGLIASAALGIHLI